MKNYKELEIEIRKYGEKHLSKRRWNHTLRVEKLALSMARDLGADKEIVLFGSLLHDIGKELQKEVYADYIARGNLESRYEENINLGHSKVAVMMAREIFGIEDDRILNTISYHTTGRQDMTIEEMIVFLADGIEPHRRYVDVHKVRDAYKNKGIKEACLMAVENNIRFLKFRGYSKDKIDSDTLKFRNWLRRELNNEY